MRIEFVLSRCSGGRGESESPFSPQRHDFTFLLHALAFIFLLGVVPPGFVCVCGGNVRGRRICKDQQQAAERVDDSHTPDRLGREGMRVSFWDDKHQVAAPRLDLGRFIHSLIHLHRIFVEWAQANEKRKGEGRRSQGARVAGSQSPGPRRARGGNNRQSKQRRDKRRHALRQRREHTKSKQRQASGSYMHTWTRFCFLLLFVSFSFVLYRPAATNHPVPYT